MPDSCVGVIASAAAAWGATGRSGCWVHGGRARATRASGSRQPQRPSTLTVLLPREGDGRLVKHLPVHHDAVRVGREPRCRHALHDDDGVHYAGGTAEGAVRRRAALGARHAVQRAE